MRTQCARSRPRYLLSLRSKTPVRNHTHASKTKRRLAKYAAEEEQARGELESANPEKRALLTHFLSELDKAVGELKQQLVSKLTAVS